MTAPLHRMTRKRTLEDAGLTHVAGWLPAEEAEKIRKRMKRATEEALEITPPPISNGASEPQD